MKVHFRELLDKFLSGLSNNYCVNGESVVNAAFLIESNNFSLSFRVMHHPFFIINLHLISFTFAFHFHSTPSFLLFSLSSLLPFLTHPLSLSSLIPSSLIPSGCVDTPPAGDVLRRVRPPRERCGRRGALPRPHHEVGGQDTARSLFHSLSLSLSLSLSSSSSFFLLLFLPLLLLSFSLFILLFSFIPAL